MRTIVVTGGTEGIGRYIAETYAQQGHRVVVIGRDIEKGRALVGTAGGHTVFRQADLSMLAENRTVIAELVNQYAKIDALVLCARSFCSWRTETPEGIETTFAHFYLSRYLFCHGLRPSLERSRSPVIVNVAGPGAALSVVRWDDLQLARNYDGRAALGQGGKLNDLLGVSFAEQYRGGRTRYVLVHPGVTATAQVGEYDPQTLAMVERMRRHAKPVGAAAGPIIDLIDASPAKPLSAFVEGRPLVMGGRDFDPSAAHELERVTRAFLVGLQGDVHDATAVRSRGDQRRLADVDGTEDDRTGGRS
jgi:NAD(P)-dependent dehydrogenase (short-subunit alcohol dehydrogenase family)